MAPPVPSQDWQSVLPNLRKAGTLPVRKLDASRWMSPSPTPQKRQYRGLTRALHVLDNHQPADVLSFRAVDGVAAADPDVYRALFRHRSQGRPAHVGWKRPDCGAEEDADRDSHDRLGDGRRGRH